MDDIEWVIAGGESGFNYRECRIEWVREIRDQCLEQRVPFFFKQWDGITSKVGGRELDGRSWSEFPDLVDKRELVNPSLPSAYAKIQFNTI